MSWDKFIEVLWAKHAIHDDYMRKTAFDTACRELIREMGERLVREINSTAKDFKRVR